MNLPSSDFSYDVLVVGAGHAGCEAAHAAAAMGARTCLLTMDMDKIAQMSCNPAIGGIAKGQIAREVDALGGLMGIVTDRTAIQFRMLNRSKGPAMWSPRAQCDRRRYSLTMRSLLEQTPGLHIWQDEAARLIVDKGAVRGVETVWGAVFSARAVVITTGTFLNGLMHVGRRMVKGGRCAEPASIYLTDSLAVAGLKSARMKTGTPVRIDSRSVHFEDMEIEPGETDFHRFSYVTEERPLRQLTCWTCQTNERVHEVLRRGLPDSPLYNGQIQSIGPRYCPSIETKLTTFPDRDSHPLFLEPEGLNTTELYLNGFSSSLPMDVQLAALKEIPCFRDVVLFRSGYAIEYDFFPPTQLRHTLETKAIDGLFLAGQVNGTTGYEEAAGQGLVAGINAAQKAGGGEPLVLGRDEAYIGVLIDDLVTKGVDEPYRMFTSRAEYRMLLRQDNADTRLTPHALRLGLATPERAKRFKQKQAAQHAIAEACRTAHLKAEEADAFLRSHQWPPTGRGCRAGDLVVRPGVTLAALADAVPSIGDATAAITQDREEAMEAAEIEMKYAGYIERERKEAEKMHRLERVKLRGHFDYAALHQLSTEARQKLAAIDPENLGQAARIPGVSPSDVSVLLLLAGR